MWFELDGASAVPGAAAGTVPSTAASAVPGAAASAVPGAAARTVPGAAARAIPSTGADIAGRSGRHWRAGYDGLLGGVQGADQGLLLDRHKVSLAGSF